MLYLAPGTGLPVRVHGAFVATMRCTRWSSTSRPPAKPTTWTASWPSPRTKAAICSAAARAGGQRGRSALRPGRRDRRQDPPAVDFRVQRHLRIGYNRAARLIEQMERSGLVSPMGTNGNRETSPRPRRRMMIRTSNCHRRPLARSPACCFQPAGPRRRAGPAASSSWTAPHRAGRFSQQVLSSPAASPSRPAAPSRSRGPASSAGCTKTLTPSAGGRRQQAVGV